MSKKESKKTKYEELIKPHLEDIKCYVSHGVTEEEVRNFYGIGKTMWYEYKKKHSELNELLCNAKQICRVNLLNRAFEVANGYEYTETTTEEVKDKDGNITGTKTKVVKRYARADAGMIQFLLINRYPEDFARDPQILSIRKESLKNKSNDISEEESNVVGI
ncbi:MAG: hypothetical protein HPY96_00700 [Bacilli bacterium]|nr:hypothetical protein [Bacilli bacterium]DAV15276.1 MAG TPA: terminase small subunit [Caudoviricetes sp.]